MFEQLRDVRERIREDVRAVIERDPAAKRPLEVILCYPGMHARWAHLLTHRLWTEGHPLLARVVATLVQSMTGVDVHPAASLGRRVTIDHGTGVVIGETAVVGDDVHMYHGVTLGGNVNEPVKRHPTVEDRATLGANATVLGDVTIGADATVGAGSVVTDPVESGTTVAGVPARPVD